MKKVRNISKNTVVIDALKTETIKFVLNPIAFTESQWSVLSSAVALHAWTYGGQVGLHDFVCAETYSVCCHGCQQEGNSSSLT